MTLTPKQKLYLAVLGVGVIALALDRTVFSPASASGQESPPAMSIATEDPTSTNSSPSEVPASALSAAWQTRSAVADRLEAVSLSGDLDPAAVRDAFHPSSVWLEGFSKDFSDQYTLLAVITGSTTNYAVIGTVNKKGKPVRISVTVENPPKGFVNTLGGFAVEEIEPRSVTFRRGDLQVVLTLIGPDASVSDNPDE